MDNLGYDLNLWEKIVEKVVDIEVKTSLQQFFEIKEIDSNCLKGYRPIKKNQSS